MKATTGSGKGDTPRPTNKQRYDAGYERVFGHDCSVCHGKGYHWDKDTMTKKMIKTTCLICKGTGRVGE